MNRLMRWRARTNDAAKAAREAEQQAEQVRGRRSLVERIVFELGVHERKNNVIGLIHDVARGIR